jgi:hypothetical protein
VIVKTVVASLVPLLLLAVACGPDDADRPAADATENPRPAATLPIPGTELPPGHPPLDEGSARLTWTIPDGWASEAPATSMRIAQYRVPGSAGDGECIVFYFGAGEGGEVMANARRWAGQFSQPDGSSSLDRMKVSSLDSTAFPVRIVEVTGTYDGGMTMTAQPTQALEGSMLLGGIAAGPDGPWFFKMTGPEATIRSQRKAFVDMMRSIRTEG